MRTDTSTNFVIEYPDLFTWERDENYIRITRPQFGVALGTCQVTIANTSASASRQLAQVVPGASTELVVHISDVLNTLGTGNCSLSITVAAGTANAYTFTATFTHRRGETMQWRDHGASRSIAKKGWDGGSENITLFVAAAPAVISYWNGSAWSTVNRPQPGAYAMSVGRFASSKGYVTIDYASANYAPSGDLWNSESGSIATIRYFDDGFAACARKGEMVLAWYDNDGLQRTLRGIVTSDTSTAAQSVFAKSDLATIKGTPARHVTGEGKTLTMQFDGIPRDMYLEDVLTSHDVTLYTADGARNMSVIPNTLSITKEMNEKADYTLTLTLKI